MLKVASFIIKRPVLLYSSISNLACTVIISFNQPQEYLSFLCQGGGNDAVNMAQSGPLLRSCVP